MQGKTIALVLAVVLLLLLPGGAALATPTPPYVFVNHTTRQCAVAIQGDDCSWCDPPTGWQVLGVSGPTQCPVGYTLVERLGLNCRRYKNQFCCSGGSHHGDCRDMVVNDSQKLCAFVPDIAGCTLPKGWAGRPISVEEYAWSCPFGYRWGDEVACLDETATPESTVIQQPTATPKPTSTSAPSGGANGFLCSLPVVAVALLALSKRSAR